MDYDTPGGRHGAMTIAMLALVENLAPRAQAAPDIVQSADVMLSLISANQVTQTVVAGMLVPLIERRLVAPEVIAEQFGPQVANLARAASIDPDVAEHDRDKQLMACVQSQGFAAVAIRLEIVRFQLRSITDEPRKPGDAFPDTRINLIDLAKKWYEVGGHHFEPNHELLSGLNIGIRDALFRLAKAKSVEVSGA